MAAKHERIIELDNESLRALVVSKGEIVEQGRALARELQSLQEQFGVVKKKLEEKTEKVGVISREIIKKVQRVAGKHINEWEIPITTEIRDGKLVLIVSDALEEFKDEFKSHDKYAAPKLKAKQQPKEI